jgi:hypothetical protein
MSNTRYNTHVCLVSEQATPNLTPLLDPAFKPEHVVLLVSPGMEARAGWLADVIRPRLKEGVEVIEIGDPWNYQQAHDAIKVVVEKHVSTGDPSVALNVTGGTKLMAMAAKAVFDDWELPVFYVHLEKNQLIWMHADLTATQIDNKLTLKDYLHVHGWEVLSTAQADKNAADRRPLTGTLVREIQNLGSVISVLNRYASVCDKEKSLSIKVTDEDARNEHFIRLASLLADHGLLVFSAGTLTFSSDDARSYCNGGWLEEHVAQVAGGLAFQDLAQGMVVRSLAGGKTAAGSENEIDVALLARNRLHIIECKTSGFMTEAGTAKAAEAEYKLDSLSKLGGLNTRGMLVSYREIRPADRQRARDLGIELVVGRDVVRLEEKLKAWVQAA